MIRAGFRFSCVLAALLFLPAAVHAAEYFVAPGPPPGEGTRAKPFNDPWRALAVCSSGDTIHIAQGVYYGRYDRSAWTIDRPKVTLLGGYDKEFTRRDPWKQPAVFAFYRDYEGTSENNLLTGAGDHTGIILDGLVFDGAGRGDYNPQPPFELRRSLQMIGPLVSLGSPDGVIRNCVFINSTAGGAELSGEGSTFENNIVMNMQGLPMLVLREKGGSDPKRPITVRGNTFAFAYDDTDPPMGKGGEKGVAIRLAAPAIIESNVFAGCGNAGINLFTRPENVSIDRNVFWLNLRADVAARIDGREMVINDKNLGEMEDLGFKSTKENRAAAAGLTGLKPAWVDGVTRNLWLAYATPPKDALNALRAKYNLVEGVKADGDGDIGPSAPLLEPADAAALRVETDAGARPVELKVNIVAAAAAAPAPTYARIDWAELNGGAPGLEGRPIEVLVAIGNERNGFVRDGITSEKYLGFDVYYPGGERFPDTINVYALRNGSAHRQFQDTTKSNNAREAEDWYLLRGIGHLSNVTRQKATIEVQSIVPASGPAKAVTPRPTGKEWFVRAGSSGGDGSREKPFRDPFQALEKAGEGDIIRVAGGDYFGKLRTANWKIAARYQSLLGGYDEEFKARDPWKNPTRLVVPPDAEKKDKSDHGAEFMQSSEICNGFILDGFIFDASTVNGYFANGGALDLGASPMGPILQLQGPDITIRNCVFANASGLAVQLSSAAGTLENNVFVNTSGTDVSITAMGPGPWTIRNNTFLFATDPTQRAGSGSGAGTHLLVRGRAAFRIESNIFAFADNCAIKANVSDDKLVLDRNAFVASLYCQFTDSSRVWLYEKVWDRRLADAGIGSARENTLALPAGLPIDKEYANSALSRLFDLKGNYTAEDWKRIAVAAGATVTPAGGATTQATAERPREEQKEKTLEELMAELDQLKEESAKRSEGAGAPKGPPYAPAYPWKAAVELVRDGATVGARRVELKD
jgi:hypothetical protein